MRQELHHIIFIVIAALLIMGCTGKGENALKAATFTYSAPATTK